MGGSGSAIECERHRDWVDAPPRLGASELDPGSRPVARWVIARSMLGPSERDVDSHRDRNWVEAGRAMAGPDAGPVRTCLPGARLDERRS
jgi:hypothetical protein